MVGMRPHGAVPGGFDARPGYVDIDIPNPGGALQSPGPFANGGIGGSNGSAGAGILRTLLGEKRNATRQYEDGG
jgi:hypothetical protein